MDIMELTADAEFLRDPEESMYVGFCATDATKGIPDLNKSCPGWDQEMGLSTDNNTSFTLPPVTGENEVVGAFDLFSDLNLTPDLDNNWENLSLGSIGLNQSQTSVPPFEPVPLVNSIPNQDTSYPARGASHEYALLGNYSVNTMQNATAHLPNATSPLQNATSHLSVPDLSHTTTVAGLQSVNIKREVPSPNAEVSSGFDECPDNGSAGRRRAQRLGESAIDKEMKKKRRKYREELSHLPLPEQKKKEKRRAQNRRAAAKCRDKKREYYDTLQDAIESEEATKTQQEEELEQLKKQINNMTTWLTTHNCVMTQQPQGPMTSQIGNVNVGVPSTFQPGQVSGNCLPGDMLAAYLDHIPGSARAHME